MHGLKQEEERISRRDFLKKTGVISLFGLGTLSIPQSLDYLRAKKITDNVKKGYSDTPVHELSDDIAVSYEAGAVMTAAGVGTNLALKYAYGVEPKVQAGTSAASANVTAFTAGLDKVCESIWVDYVSKPPFANHARGLCSLFSDVSFFSNESLVNEIFSHEEMIPNIQRSDSELLLATLNAETGQLAYHSSVDDEAYFYDSLPDIVLSNLAEPITYGRNVQVQTGRGVEPCFDAFYGETILHKHEKLEDMLSIYVASRTENQVNKTLKGSSWKRKVREWLSLRNTEYEAKEDLIENIQQTSINDRQRIKKQEHSVLLEPRTPRSRTNTNALYISESIRNGFLEAVQSTKLHNALGMEPDFTYAQRVIQ